MSIKKYTDWAGWLAGMRSKVFQAGATSVVTSLSTLVGTNGLAHMGVPGLQDIGMNWKTAIAQMLVQFGLHVTFAAAKYVQDKPDPDVIEQNVQTVIMTKQDIQKAISPTIPPTQPPQ